MRGTRAKALRRANPMRPNPGRKEGGTPKMLRHMKAPTPRRPKTDPDSDAAIWMRKTGRKFGDRA